MMKLITSLMAFAMLFAVATSAKATCGVWGCPPEPTPSPSVIKVTNGVANVTTVSKAEVYTGGVSQLGGMMMAKTGDIYSVGSTSLAQVNTTKLPGCACSKPAEITVNNMFVESKSIATAEVDTGSVKQMSLGGMKVATTGSVSYVTTDAQSGINYTDFSVTP